MLRVIFTVTDLNLPTFSWNIPHTGHPRHMTLHLKSPRSNSGLLKILWVQTPIHGVKWTSWICFWYSYLIDCIFIVCHFMDHLEHPEYPGKVNRMPTNNKRPYNASLLFLIYNTSWCINRLWRIECIYFNKSHKINQTVNFKACFKHRLWPGSEEIINAFNILQRKVRVYRGKEKVSGSFAPTVIFFPK